ncbi:Dihydrofolate reductase [uncultured virus]|nr:Dihydrofolate reductase [uncultured virus]
MSQSARISLIVAMDANGVIGNNGCLPWHLPADLIHFRKMTLGKAIIMGRKTHDSIGRALPGRKNIIVSRNANLVVKDCVVVSDLESALDVCEPGSEAMVVGGSDIYRLALPLATCMYVTHIHGSYDGSVFFPQWDQNQWTMTERSNYVAETGLAYSIVTYQRKSE